MYRSHERVVEHENAPENLKISPENSRISLENPRISPIKAKISNHTAPIGNNIHASEKTPVPDGMSRHTEGPRKSVRIVEDIRTGDIPIRIRYFFLIF